MSHAYLEGRLKSNKYGSMTSPIHYNKGRELVYTYIEYLHDMDYYNPLVYLRKRVTKLESLI